MKELSLWTGVLMVLSVVYFTQMMADAQMLVIQDQNTETNKKRTNPVPSDSNP